MCFTIFWYFILGMTFSLYLNPILTSLVEVAMAYLELIKGKISLKLSTINTEIQKATDIEDDHRVIGFAIPSENDYEEDEE